MSDPSTNPPARSRADSGPTTPLRGNYTRHLSLQQVVLDALRAGPPLTSREVRNLPRQAMETLRNANIPIIGVPTRKPAASRKPLVPPKPAGLKVKKPPTKKK